MATTTDAPAGVQMIALQEIGADRNVRQQLDAEEVDALAQSINLLGQLTPVSVRPAEELALEVDEERADQWRVEVGEVQAAWWFAGVLLREAKEQAQRVAIGGECVWA